MFELFDEYDDYEDIKTVCNIIIEIHKFLKTFNNYNDFKFKYKTSYDDKYSSLISLYNLEDYINSWTMT